MKEGTRRTGGAWMALTVATLLLPALAHAAVDSGSICATAPGDPDCLGDVSYDVNTQIALPADGFLQYGNLTIAAGVTVTFTPNTVNTPVFILASGDVTIAGDINISGAKGADVGANGDGSVGDDGNPGPGGPGGYAGGAGGLGGGYGGSGATVGGRGGGPGGGEGGSSVNQYRNGGGAGFSTVGAHSYYWGGNPFAAGGPAYGQDSQQPLIGGSGGGAGGGGDNFTGSGAGGGGGAILIVASGTIDLSGSIVADGGNAGVSSFTTAGYGGTGGGGSGGAIRLIATTINGNGGIFARYGVGANGLGYGAYGRIRLEAENYGFTSSTTPAYTTGDPGPIPAPNDPTAPTLRIASVGGTAVPAQPTGSADVSFPEGQAQPLTVVVEASEIPLGTTVTVWMKPYNGDAVSYLTPALAGTLQNSSASVDVTFPPGPSVLEASASFTLVVGGGSAALTYGDETIKLAEIRVDPSGRNSVFYVTESGKRIPESEVGPLTYAMAQTARGS